VIGDNGDAPLASFRAHDAEAATLGGSVIAGFSNYSSGLAKAGNIDAGAAKSVTISNLTVPADGVSLLEVDYLTSGPRSFFWSTRGEVS